MPVYNLLLCLSYPLMWLAARFHRRLRINFQLRALPVDFSAARGRMHIWFHAASAGEFEQVRAIAIEMKRRHKNVFCSFSYFSDSAYQAKQNDQVPDVLFALPFDFPWRMARLVKNMQPDALIIGKYDAWPNQVLLAQRAGVPVFLASATLPGKSLRYKWPLKTFMHGIYAPMRRIFAINEEHARRLRKISPLNVEILGDTRYDAIAERLKETSHRKKELSRLRKLTQGKAVIVGGSTYATSERMIAEFLATHPRIAKKPVLAIVAPHHVREKRLLEVEGICTLNRLRTARFSRLGAQPADIVILDSLGLLPFVYGLADVAYVGGGFEGSVHSVIEAAVEGVPIITGPAIENSAEALDLAKSGLIEKLPKSDGHAFASAVENVCKTHASRRKQTLQYFRQRLGVSRQIVHTVMDDILRD